MKSYNEKGFSLIEIIIVIVIIGLVSVISIPFLLKAKYAAENGAILATIRVMTKEEVNFYVTKSRYARLDELNLLQSNAFGTTSSNTIKRGDFTFSMSPATPTDTALATDYTIIATKTIDANNIPYVISVGSSGEIVQITP